ncbi:mRNA cap guanine-N7 methyltransferase [Borealophlyctis nickersoniae]|nr:mRNA cap guanine-N7 methyltransferase [Borealophlyctis nickersoniae]
MKRQNEEEESPRKAVRTEAAATAGSSFNSSHVAEHYNARPEVGRAKRNESPILRLKNFNNWVKSVLIGQYARRGFNVLDLCCGKGGDLLKWSKAGIADLIGVDIAEVSVQQAAQRYKEGRSRFSARFHARDCFAEPLSDLVPPGHKFDLVSCQFALHYSFESEKKARMALQNITQHLKPGGHFLGTIPNAYWLVKKLRATEGLSFGNSILKITFEQKDNYPMFGHKFFFELTDAIDDCPEYLLYFPKLVELAAEYGLELLFKEPFHEFYEKAAKVEANRALLRRMNVVHPESALSNDEWEVAGLYIAFAFRKKS